MKNILLIVISFAFYLFNFTETKANYNQLLDEAINNPQRENSNKQRDIYRNPKQTLLFFNIDRNKKILEISPGRGWYTEIIGNFMKNTNNFFVAKYKNPQVKIIKKIQKEFDDYFLINREFFGNIKSIYIDKSYHIISEKEEYDMILTFRNTHNWLDNGMAENIYKSFYKILKKGGTLGVVQHRANESSNFNFKNGYVKESFLINFIETLGFRLIEKSEINSNAKDLKNYPKGVWTLPPRLIMGNENKSTYLKIGESDRMTLKFIKE